MIANGFILFVMLQHVAFAVLEMFFWNTPTGRKIFRTAPEFAEKSKFLAANQGLYNLFLAAGLLASFLVDEVAAHLFQYFFLSCVVIAGTFGAATVHKKIFFVQALPALAALFLVMLGK